MIIDSHQHFWRYHAERHAWITDDMAAIRKNFLPNELQEIYRKNDVDGCVAVQVDQTEADTEFMVSLSRYHPFIRGVVGWVDLRADNLTERLEYYSGEPIVKGFRHIVQGEVDPDFLLRKNFCDGVSKLGKHGFTYDILVYHHQLRQVESFARLFPDQPFIIDHIAKPDIRNHDMERWAKHMKAIARYPNVYCKLSGMVTEANWSTWTYDDLEPYINTVLESFGTHRILYGSDWPVCLVAASYEEQFSAVHKAIEKL